MTQSANVQQFIVGLIVLGAAAFIVRRVWSAIASARAAKNAACGSGCGCEPAAATQRAKKTAR
jgi:FeoB-associated Cys-rich membrane protein